MTLSDIAIHRPVLTWVMMLALVVAGVLGVTRLGVDQFPPMEFPTVMVVTELKGANPEGMEEDVTDVLEENLNTIAGVRELRSTTLTGVSQIVVEFQLGTNLDKAIQDVRDEVGKARRYLPKDTETPVISKTNFSDQPILWIPFSSHRSPVETSEYVRRQVKPLLETIPGVGGVVMFGRRDRAIRIWIDGEALRSRGLAATDVMAALQREHVDIPGGLVEGSRVEWTVKTDAEYRSTESLERMVIVQRPDAPVFLKDVARVEDGEDDVRALARFRGVPTVGLGVRKQTGANTVAICDEVNRRLNQLKPLLPEGITIGDGRGFIDFSQSIRESVAETEFALVFGGLLAVLTVFVFLRRTRPTLIVAAAIPVSLITTFALVWIAGYTLNTMTLLGMALAIGVVIDDAIIVLENIERHREMGKDGRTAAADGTRQITFAATAATLSVTAVFLPVVFVQGIVGNMLSEFGLTVAGSVMISLFVALTLTPMLAARMPAPKEREHGSIYHYLEIGFAKVEQLYERALDWSLGHQWTMLGIALASLFVAFGAASRLGAELFPITDRSMFFSNFETPPGTSLAATTEMLDRNEKYMLEQPELVGLFEAVGMGGRDGVPRANQGIMFATLKPMRERKRSVQQVITDARDTLGAIPGQNIKIFDPSSMQAGGGAQFEVALRGNLALADLDSAADKFIDALRRKGGFVDLDKSLKLGLPEVRVLPDREKAAELGVDASTLSQVVQLLIGGLRIGTFKDGGHRFDIRMRLEQQYRDTPDAIENLYVRGMDGKLTSLRNLVALQTGAAPSEITRSDRQRSVTVTANLHGKPLGTAIQDAFEVGKRVLPKDITLALSGSAQSMQESARQFLFALGLGLLVIYMVLAAQFESFVHPLSVMLAVPFAMVGAMLGLWATHNTLNLFSVIGILLLCGLVTKNSILLVDYANQLRSEGLDKRSAMRRAAPIRMRPVLMTAVAMIFGVLPAAVGVGPGAETRAPMAIATACGMLSSLLLTLLIVPVFYLKLDDGIESLKHLARRSPRAVREASAADASLPAADKPAA
jgi:hydrophobe/amphiphile efflux-1 (HAE1) family protein